MPASFIDFVAYDGLITTGSQPRPADPESFELVSDESRQLGALAGLGVGDEAGRTLLHQAIWRGLRGAAAFVVDRGAIGRPPELQADGLHDGLLVR